MPVSPAQVAAQAIQAAGGYYKTVCADIDRCLMETPAHDEGGRWFAVSKIHHRTKLMVEMIIKDYTSAGWRVRYVNDGRDGDALVFYEK